MTGQQRPEMEQTEHHINEITLRYKFRLYPTPGQQRALAKAFGCARVVFNDALQARQDAHSAGLPYPTDAELSKRLITEAKRTPGRAWLSEVSHTVLQQALRDLNVAYRNFFDSIAGRRKGSKMNRPRFRSRKAPHQTIRFTRRHFSVRASGKLYLARIGEVPVRWSRVLPSEPSTVTVILDAAQRYFASFVVRVQPQMLPKRDDEVGIDLGLASFAVLSNGTKIDSPRFLQRAERKLRRAHQELGRKQKGSRNREKARLALTRAYSAVADARRDWLHKLSTSIIRENQAVYVEDLDLASFARTRLAKRVHDAGWGQFLTMLEYKAVKHGRYATRIERHFPSSQICSSCGHRDGPKPVRVRRWTCGACGTRHDRDENAARNILAAGRAERLNACGGDVRPRSPAAVLADPREAGTHRGAA